MKVFKRIIGVLLSLVLLVVLVVAGYVIYMEAVYYRIPDHQILEPDNNATKQVNKNEEYSITSYNFGFGAYSQDYTFFMDKGSKDGVETKGKESRARSKEECLENMEGSANILKELNSDFMFIQEVDKKAHRSYFMDQESFLSEKFSSYGSTYALNYHMPYMCYPFPVPHGAVEAGLLTLSQYKITSSERRALPITQNWIKKMFELDRSFMVNRLPITGSDKELVLINIHMSAYDEEGFRDKQVAMLNEVLKAEKSLGNYVIVGGDFNHDVSNSLNAFPTKQDRRTTMPRLTNTDLTSGYTWADAKNNAPTCRNCNMPFIEGDTLTFVCDGFIVSDNIKINLIENIDKKFKYTDHNPVYLKFELK